MHLKFMYDNRHWSAPHFKQSGLCVRSRPVYRILCTWWSTYSALAKKFPTQKEMLAYSVIWTQSANITEMSEVEWSALEGG